MSPQKEDTRVTQAAKVVMAVLLVAAVVTIEASDRVGIYGVIDKVVFEPNAENPERVQLWGAFAVATRTDRDFYDPVATGYLYFKLPENQKLARTEWNDLKALAGTKKIVAFSSRLGQSVRLRLATEQPKTPDNYVLATGVRTMRPDIDHAPIKALSVHISR